MPSAVGAYATTAAVKLRLGIATLDTTDDTLLGTICDQVNQYIEGPEGAARVLAPVSSATYLFDGDETPSIYFPRGIRAITLLEVASTTGATYTTLASTDYVLRPHLQDRESGFPATWIRLTDTAATGFRCFPFGFDTVRVTMTTGWAAIPDDITNVALTMAVRAWHSRQSGQADIVGNDETGAPVVSRYVSVPDRMVLKKYRTVVPPR